MQKIRLQLSDLHVETFAVIPGPEDGRGTVLARSHYFTDSPGMTGPCDCWTEDHTCGGSCPCESETCTCHYEGTRWCPEEDDTGP